MKTHSGRPRKGVELPKDFPLQVHTSGKFAKRIRGKVYYFGRWADPAGALKEYNSIKGDLARGVDPRRQEMPRAFTVLELCEYAMDTKETDMKSGRFSKQSLQKWLRVLKLFVEHIGKYRDVASLQARDFSGYMATLVDRGFKLETLNTHVGVIRGLFRLGYEHELIERIPRFGSLRPATKIDLQRQKEGTRMVFTPDELNRILAIANARERLPILLGLNCGFGATDVIELEFGHVCGDWLEMRRAKTMVPRRCYLWPETVACIETFRRGHAGGKIHPLTLRNSVSRAFARVRDRAGVEALRFYALRHTYATVARQIDADATRVVMGHSDSTVLATYTHAFDDARLIRVSDHVHGWLFGETGLKVLHA